MNRKLVMGIAFLAILGLTFMLSSFFISKKTLPPQRPTPETKNYVKVLPFSQGNVPIALETYGRVGSSQPLNLVAEVGGRMLPGSINFKEGENFKTGQLLLRINNTEQKLTLQSRKSNFLNLLATVLPDVKMDFPATYANWQTYYDAIDLDKDLPVLPENMTNKEKAFMATKNILSEYFAIKSLEENLSKYSLFAPYNGSIQTINIEIGSVVNPGVTIASIIRTDKLELKVPVEIKDIDFIKIGSEVTIEREGKNSKSWKGKVARKADFVDANTQSVSVYVSVENAASDIYDGQYLKATIPGPMAPNSMLLNRAVIRNKDEVFVVQGDRLITKKVNILKVLQNEVVINGLTPGDLIVVEAPSNASNNMKVEITE